jgi:hypothetical protein
MDNFFTVVMFVLFFLVLPALDKRNRDKRKRAQGQQLPPPETTFEQSQAERRGESLPIPAEAAPSRAAPGGLGELWAEIEQMSKGEFDYEPALEPEVEEPAPIILTPMDDTTARPMPMPAPAAAVYTPGQDSIITPRRAAPPPLEAPAKRRHTGRLTHSHGATTIMGHRVDAEELRRAVLYREILGPPVSLRRDGSHSLEGDSFEGSSD